jgi:hypothetical protein
MWLIISDSHDNIKTLSKAVEMANNKGVDHLFHCGDIIAPFSARILKKFSGELHVVFGNNDGEKFGLKRILGENLTSTPYALNIDGFSILMMHVFYGHTHELVIERRKASIIINPGDSSGWVSGNPTCVIVEPGKTENVIEL